MDTIHEMTTLIKFSPKHDVKFDAIKKELEPDTPGFRILCPTRWTVQSCSLKSVLDNYAQLWDDCLEEHLQSDVKARIIGIQAQMKKSEFFCGLQLGYLILRHSDNFTELNYVSSQ